MELGYSINIREKFVSLKVITRLPTNNSSAKTLDNIELEYRHSRLLAKGVRS